VTPAARPTYETLRAAFEWQVPPKLNMGELCADRHPATDLALIFIDARGRREDHTFGALASASNRLAHGLASAAGVTLGDRVGIVLPQCVETGIAHLALYKAGAIALPLSGLFGADALRYRLSDSAARAIITDAGHLEAVAEIAAETDAEVVCIDGSPSPHHDFWDLVAKGADVTPAVTTTGDTPALLIYTSGTTGPAKGALHAHRVLHGHLPGFDLAHEFFGRPNDRFWTPADWAWIGGLMDGLMPAWFHGKPVVAAARAKFDPEWALRLMAEHDVRNVFLPPTALKLMRQSDASEAGVRLRTIMSGGEPLGEEILAWTRDRLGVTINEIYGQTEANLVVGNCAAAWEVRPGSMGRPFPGHDVIVLADDGTPCPDGELGQLAIQAPDPVMFLGYWEKPVETQAKFTADGRWLLTGDLGRADGEGYLWYAARDDDVINSGGYRIGPAEIEACLMRHPSVAMAAAIGIPDELRGEIVKAFVVAAPGVEPSPGLEREIRDTVKYRLAAYLYPREIEFVEALPLTTTGKIRRLELRERESARASDSG
jgi:acetyl-CoA synthetase